MSGSRIVWIYPTEVKRALDSATWLQTTQALRHLGWDVTLVAVGPREQTQVDGIDVTCLPTIQRYFLGTVVFHLRVLALIVANWQSIEIVLFHQLSVPWLLPLRLLRLFWGGRRPLLVMDTRDLNVVEGTWKNRLRTRFFSLAHKLANWGVDGQTTITPRMTALVQAPPQQCWGCWPSGVSLERFTETQVKRTWPQGDEPIHLMYVGKLHAERNLLPLAQAVEQANATGMSFLLSYVGSGPEQPRLAAFAAQSADRIRIVPAVTHEQIPLLLQQAHVGVTSLPAVEDEKFQASSPIKLFEYMAAGLPILSTANPCHTDVVAEGRYAFWADAATAEALSTTLRQIWQRRSQLATLGQEARHAVDPWTWEGAARQLDEALRYGLAQAQASPPRRQPQAAR
jgi:glycosyltransferase involved in cell wall biosynthesis